MKKRTDSYLMTIDPMSCTDMEKIAIVRKTIAIGNKTKLQTHKWQVKRARRWGEPEPKAPTLHRVSLKARLGKNNPAYAKYRDQYIKSIKLEDAQRIDVYIHERRS
jgi:hypothetical protein